MGTRNLTMVKKDGEIKVAQYGQWDGYPSGNGLVILDFLRWANLNYLKQQVDKVKKITKEELKALWVEAGADPESDFVTMDVSDKFRKINPQLSRDTGADILEIILKNPQDEILLDNDVNFAKDGLFCEWAYLVDLDENKLEVYKGFNKEPLTPEDRFYFDGYVSDSGYTPIKLIKTYNIEELPTNDEFVEELESCDEE